MAEQSYPFSNQATSEGDYSQLFRELQDTGVFETAGAGQLAGSALTVSADSSGMNVKVAAGSAIVQGYAYRNTAQLTLTIAAATAQPRIDAVVLRLDPASDLIKVAVVQGTAAASPVAPNLSQTTTGIYEMLLAQVYVAANAVTVAANAVTDYRTRIGSRVGDWTTVTRPPSPRTGQLGRNRTSGRFEYFDGSAWVDLVSWSAMQSDPAGSRIYVQTGAPTGPVKQGDLWFQVNT